MDDDLNNMSMEDLVRFAEQGILPDNVNTDAPDEVANDDDDFDMNFLSPEQLLAMANGKAHEANNKTEEAIEEATEEASAAELLAMLDDTVSEDELDSSNKAELAEIGKNIEKIKLRQLANKLGSMTPSKLFPQKKDEIYYFLSSMVGQAPKIRIENADKKCRFIGESLSKLEAYMVSEVGFSLDESAMLISSFEDFAKDTVSETESRNLVFQQFRFGWKQTLKKAQRGFENLKKFASQKEKPLWVLSLFYESLSRSYGLCRASDSFKEYAEELGATMQREEKQAIVDLFEEIIELAPFYGLKNISFINRKQAYQALGELDLESILEKLKRIRNRV